MEEFQFDQVELTSVPKVKTWNTGSKVMSVILNHKQSIYANYKIDNINFKALVASYRYEKAKRATYITLYNESGINPLEVEALLYDVITKTHLEDIEAYYNGDFKYNFNHTFTWLISSIAENRHKRVRKEQRMLIKNTKNERLNHGKV